MKQTRQKHSSSKPQSTALDKVAELLARRDHSEKELYEKLSQKGFSSQDSSAAIEYAWEHKWLLPPEELAERVKLQLDEKGKGFLYIQSYLQSKGLPCPPKNSETEKLKAQRLLQKKFETLKPNTSNEEKKKQTSRFLKNKGFDFETINATLSSLF